MNLLLALIGNVGLENTFWYIAIPTTLVMLFQLFLTAYGGDFDSDVEIDVDMEGDMDTDGESDGGDHGHFKLLTFRGLISFCAVGSWTGLSLLKAGYADGTVIIWALIAGFVSMFMLAGIAALLHRMREEVEPSTAFKNAVGKSATVYLDIPSKGKGKGKVNIIIGGTLKVVDAYSDGPEFKVGSKVKISKVDGGEVFVEEYQ
jgi:membrane protein implicated in regulation of membrane protease activity